MKFLYLKVVHDDISAQCMGCMCDFVAGKGKVTLLQQWKKNM